MITAMRLSCRKNAPVAKYGSLACKGPRAVFWFVLLPAIGLMFSLPAQGEIQLGVAAGRMSVDVASRSAPWNLALSLGYPIDTRLANLRVLAEINRTASHGEARDGDDLEFESNGILLELKSNHPVYFSLRGGFVEYRVVGSGAESDELGIALGAGLGVISGRARIVLEYTSYDGEADFLSLGLKF
jgi:hypothetical protein